MQNMQKICKRSAENVLNMLTMQQIRNKYATNMHNVQKELPKICRQKYAAEQMCSLCRVYILHVYAKYAVARGTLLMVSASHWHWQSSRSPGQPGARAHRNLLHFSIFGLSATDKKGFQNTGRYCDL